MGPRKRGRDEMESSQPAPELSMLDKLRNTWELSNLMQYIFIFGKAVKIDEDLDIEVHAPAPYQFTIIDLVRLTKINALMSPLKQDLERECLSPNPSQVLSDIGLALLKYVSSHRGLT